jgi:hypothetical protein
MLAGLRDPVLEAAPDGLPPVQYWYLTLAGGLTTPAMWPEPATM